VHKDGGKNPVWNHTCEFDLKDCQETHAVIKIWNQNVGIDDMICMVKLPLCALVSFEKQRWYPLFRDPKNRFPSGKLLLRCEFKGKGGFPKPPPSSKFGILSAHYGTREIQTDVSGFLETKVADMKLVFKKEQDLSSYFGFDPLDGHISNKLLYVTYLSNNEETTVIVKEKHHDVEIPFEDYELRKAEAEKAILARKEMEAKQAAAELEHEKALAEERAKKEAELKAALEAKLKEREKEAKNVHELRMRMATELAEKEAYTLELLDKITALESANDELTAENSRLENENEKYRAENNKKSNRRPKIFGAVASGMKSIQGGLKKFNPFGGK